MTQLPPRRNTSRRGDGIAAAAKAALFRLQAMQTVPRSNARANVASLDGTEYCEPAAAL